MKTFFSNIMCLTLSAAESRAFKYSTTSVKRSQELVLKKILKVNSDTEYGRRFSFSEIDSIGEFQKQVPIVDYSCIAAYINRIAEGEEDILFPGRPFCLQPTSGSTSAPKMIPFTVGLRNEYQKAVSPWYLDMNMDNPSMLKGSSYWSLTPAISETTRTKGGLPVGFLDDIDYLSSAFGHFIKNNQAVPGEVGFIKDAESFRYVTMAFLLKAKDLSFISVWNPTFFILLMDSLYDNLGLILEDIRRGQISLISTLPENLRGRLTKAFSPPDAERADELRFFLSEKKENWKNLYPMLWPDLKLISCWDHAEAKGSADRLREIFPGVTFQAKGLMATEGVISIPLHDAPYPVLSLRSHFYEFVPVGDGSKPLAAWELEKDGFYEVVLTTGGGLYRYRLGDYVKVRGFYNDCPMIEFIGRGNSVSDFYGEKLHQLHVSEIIRTVFNDKRPSSYFALLAPDGKQDVDHYTLFVACEDQMDEKVISSISHGFEGLLRSNFHYDYCRKLGQLKELEICMIGSDVNRALVKYMEEKKRRGLREGDIKPAVLDHRPVWKNVFEVCEHES